jgi:hypothetical protein
MDTNCKSQVGGFFFLSELEGECLFQGFLLQFTQIAIFGWITVIAVNLFLVVVMSRNTAKFEVGYHVVVWALAIILTAIPLAGKGFGPAGVWYVRFLLCVNWR